MNSDVKTQYKYSTPTKYLVEAEEGLIKRKRVYEHEYEYVSEKITAL